MIKKIRIGKISYINASPVYYGLDHGLLPEWIEMVPDVPSTLNRQIMAGDIQISPISAAFYAMNHNDLLLLPDLSISCHGPVMSVILASNYPLEALNNRNVIFSPESASAASFLQMIFRQKNITPLYRVHPVHDCKVVAQKADAALVIGDSALTQPWHEQFTYCVDLGQLWYDMTQLPFVFAVWVVRKNFAQEHPDKAAGIHRLLLESKTRGYRNIDKVVESGCSRLKLGRDIISRYFKHLYCDLDNEKLNAMKLFFDSLYEQGVLSEKAHIRFFDPKI